MFLMFLIVSNCFSPSSVEDTEFKLSKSSVSSSFSALDARTGRLLFIMEAAPPPPGRPATYLDLGSGVILRMDQNK